MKRGGPIQRKKPMARSGIKRKGSSRVQGTSLSSAAKPGKESCRRRSCNHPGRFEGWCGSHAMSEADRLFSLYIRGRDGACRACGRTDRLQCAHLVSREYKLIRYSRPNAVALCAMDHWRFTAHPGQWWVFCNERWPGRIERLEFLGRMGVRRKYHPDYGAAIRNYSKGGKKDEATSRW